jgi:hypothetical protein
MFQGHIKGLVEEIGADKNLGKVKVKFPQFDDLISDWLPVLQPAFRFSKNFGI